MNKQGRKFSAIEFIIAVAILTLLGSAIAFAVTSTRRLNPVADVQPTTLYVCNGTSCAPTNSTSSVAITTSPAVNTTNVTWNGTYTLAATTTAAYYSDSWSYNPKVVAMEAVTKISAVTSGSTLTPEVCEDTFTEGSADSDCNKPYDGSDIFSNVTAATYYRVGVSPRIAGTGKKIRYKYQQFTTAVNHNVTVQRETLEQN